MASKTKIGDSFHTVNDAKMCIEGAAYTIKKGKTKIGDSFFNINFDKTYYISAWDDMDDGIGYVVINNTKYSSEFTDIPISKGTEISLKVSSSHADQAYRCKVKINDVIVKEGDGFYYFKPTDNCSIRFVGQSTVVNWTLVTWTIAEITM